MFHFSKGLCFLFVLFPFSLQAAEVLTLREAYKEALNRSESIAVQEETLNIAEAHYLQALGTVLPQLEARGTELIQDTSGVAGGGSAVGSTFTRRSRPEVAITLSQPLFQGFREFRALKISSTEKKRNALTLDRAKQLLFSDITRAYYAVLAVQEEHALQSSILDSFRSRLNELKKRVGLGKSRESELLSTESEIALAEANVERTNGLVATARDLLGFYLGRPATEKVADEFPLPGQTPSLENFLGLLNERPDLGASAESVRLAQGKLSYEKGARYPFLDVDANYYPYRVGFLSDINWDVSFGLKVPIFSGGATRGKIREAKAGLKQAELSHQEEERRVELEVRQAYHDYLSLRSQETALGRAEVKAKANYQSLSGEYSMGLANNLEVLDSLRGWQSRRLEASQARFQSKLGYLNLLLATGQLPPKAMPKEIQ